MSTKVINFHIFIAKYKISILHICLGIPIAYNSAMLSIEKNWNSFQIIAYTKPILYFINISHVYPYLLELKGIIADFSCLTENRNIFAIKKHIIHLKIKHMWWFLNKIMK